MVRQPRRAEDAVTFAAKIFRREPAVVPRRPEPDEFADGIQVGGVAEKFVGLFVLRRAAETGGHRVNEHQIAAVQDGILVVHQPERRRRQRAVVVHLHAARAERAEVQPHGRRAGTAVETKRDRARGLVGFAGARVGDVKDRRAHRAGGRRESATCPSRPRK